MSSDSSFENSHISLFVFAALVPGVQPVESGHNRLLGLLAHFTFHIPLAGLSLMAPS